MEFTFNFGIGMAIFLSAIIISAGSIVALVFRRITSRIQERESQLHQQHQ